MIAGVDHRETAFSAKAFAEMFRFLAGRPPATLAIVPEAIVVLDGIVSGLGLANAQGDFATNLPLAGATVEVYATQAATGERLGSSRCIARRSARTAAGARSMPMAKPTTSS